MNVTGSNHIRDYRRRSAVYLIEWVNCYCRPPYKIHAHAFRKCAQIYAYCQKLTLSIRPPYKCFLPLNEQVAASLLSFRSFYQAQTEGSPPHSRYLKEPRAGLPSCNDLRIESTGPMRSKECRAELRWRHRASRRYKMTFEVDHPLHSKRVLL
jgi:hypothetical protein